VAFRTAEMTDPGDRNGAGLRLMRLGAATIAGMRPTYVKALFDQYAPRFEAALVDDLDYRGPALLLAAVAVTRAAAGRPLIFSRAIDLGCGTGLAARAFSAVVDEIIGIDLSPRMIERARATGLYAELDVSEIVEGLGGRPDGCADLILAADVMVYVHDMTALLREVARVLAAGGLFRVHGRKPCGRGRGVERRAALRLWRKLRASARRRRGPRARPVGIGIVSHESGVQVPGLVVVAAKA